LHPAASLAHAGCAHMPPEHDPPQHSPFDWQAWPADAQLVETHRPPVHP
jgi:hypothetical protein